MAVFPAEFQICDRLRLSPFALDFDERSLGPILLLGAGPARSANFADIDFGVTAPGQATDFAAISSNVVFASSLTRLAA